MRNRILAVSSLLLICLGIGTAQAQTCYVPSGGSEWDGAERSTSRTLCQQRRLNETTRGLSDDIRWQTDLGTLAARTERLLQQQRDMSRLID